MEQSYYFGMVALDEVLGLCIVTKNAGVPAEPDGSVTYRVVDPLTGTVLTSGALAPLPDPIVGVYFGQVTAAKAVQFATQRNYAILFTYFVNLIEKSIEGYFTVD
jgi:hypothetical protein